MAGRAARTSSPSITTTRAKYRNHWGIAVDGSARGGRRSRSRRPASSTSRKWTRTQTNRLLLEAGFGIYNQEYTELYQPSVTGLDDKVWDLEAIRNVAGLHACSISRTTEDRRTRGTTPADHFSLLRTYMGAASYVTGSHTFRFGGTVTQGDWRLLEQWTGDVQPITYNAGRPVR